MESNAAVYLIVAHEKATPNLLGVKGKFKYSSETEHFFEPLAAGPRVTGVRACRKEWCTFIPEVEAKRAQLPWDRNCLHMSSQLAVNVTESMSFKPQEQVKEADLDFLLAYDHVDCGTSEILMRLLPGPGFLVCPAGSAHFLAGSRQWTLGEQEQIDGDFFRLLQGGKVIVIPVCSGTHWTMLVLERIIPGYKPSTSFIQALGAKSPVQRNQAEKAQFEPLTWPELQGKEERWEVRYYDTLNYLNQRCQRIAKAVLKVLAPWALPEILPARKHMHRQGGWNSCGRWILHYAEEEARVYLGERRASFWPDLLYRARRVNKFAAALTTRASQVKPADSSIIPLPWLPVQKDQLPGMIALEEEKDPAKKVAAGVELTL